MKNQDPSSQIYLQPGDTVDIVAPSSKCHPSIFQKIETLLNAWELQCHIPDNLFGEDLLYANNDEMRFNHLKNALLNNTSKAVWCLLGGFGSTKLLPMLSTIKPPPQKKIFIGFSDITALHIFLQNQWGWTTIHGPSCYQAALNKVSPNSIELLHRILFRKTETLIYDNIPPLNTLAENNLTINAPIIGGNLHLIQTSLGTAWQIDANEKILFIEEVNERAYRIDRVLAHLQQASIFNHIKAILFGDMIDKGEPNGKFLVKDILREFAARCNMPVIQVSNIGHGPINNPILLGSIAKLSLGNSATLEFPL